LLMQTMVPLRVANMAGCTFFVAFGALSGNVATFLLYLLLLPINASSPPSNVESDQEGTYCDGGRYLNGMAQPHVGAENEREKGDRRKLATSLHRHAA